VALLPSRGDPVPFLEGVGSTLAILTAQCRMRGSHGLITRPDSAHLKSTTVQYSTAQYSTVQFSTVEQSLR